MEKFSNFSTRFSIKMFTIFHHFSPFFTILKINLLNVPELSLNCSDLFRPRQFVKGDLMGTKHVIKITFKGFQLFFKEKLVEIINQYNILLYM